MPLILPKNLNFSSIISHNQHKSIRPVQTPRASSGIPNLVKTEQLEPLIAVNMERTEQIENSGKSPSYIRGAK